MKKKLAFILFLLPFSLAYGQSSIGENPYFYMLVTKSMGMKTGKIDFIEHKRIKGLKKPLTTYYTLIFSKDISYKTENKKINIHFFNEQDSILYLVDDNASYLIDYKKKEVVINEKNEVIFLMRKNHLFANFYSNQAGGGLLLMGRIRDSVKTDFSTTISVTEQKIFTELYNLQSKTALANEKLFCYEKYEFRDADTLLIQHVSKISNPYNYEKGTVVEIETKLLYALLDDQEYEKTYYYNYEEFCNDDFHFYDKRKSLVVDEYIYHDENLERNDKAALQSLIAENKIDNIYSSHFLELEDGMMTLYMQVREGQQEIAEQKREWQEITDIRVFNMNLYTLPTKSIQPISLNEIEIVHVYFPISSDTAKNISDEYLAENQEESVIAKEGNLLSENSQEVIADTLILPIETDFGNISSEISFEKEGKFAEIIIPEIVTEDILAEEFIEEDPIDVELVESVIENILAEEVSPKDFLENETVDTLFSDTIIENIASVETVVEEFIEEDPIDVELVESAIENILAEEVSPKDFLENETIDMLFSDTIIENIASVETVVEEFIEEDPIDVELVESAIENILAEEVSAETRIENKTVDTLISDAKIENIVSVETVVEEFIEEDPIDVELVESAIENILAEAVSPKDFLENETVDTLFSDTIIENIASVEAVVEEFIEEDPIDVELAESAIENILAEAVSPKDFLENETIDTLFSDTIIENIASVETVVEEFIEEDPMDVELVESAIENILAEAVSPKDFLENETVDTLFSDTIIENIASVETVVEESVDSVFFNIKSKISNNTEIIDTVAVDVFAKSIISENDSGILLKEELRIDTIISTSLANEITNDSLTVAEGIKIVSDTLEKLVIVENVNVEVVYLDSIAGENQEPETLENEPMYYIVLNYFKDMENAKVFFNDKKKLYANLLHLGKDASSGTYMVGIGPYKTENEAQDTLDNMWVKNVRGWIIRQ